MGPHLCSGVRNAVGLLLSDSSECPGLLLLLLQTPGGEVNETNWGWIASFQNSEVSVFVTTVALPSPAPLCLMVTTNTPAPTHKAVNLRP